MDIQDAQDNKDGTLLQGKSALEMIGYGFADTQEFRTIDLEKSCASCALMSIVKKSIPYTGLAG